MPKNKNKKTGVGRKGYIVLLMLLILGLVGFSGYMYYQIHTLKSQSTAKQDATLPPKKNHPAPPPIYIELDAFTVSLKPDEEDSDRVLYVGLTLRLKDEKSKALIVQFLPEVRSRLLLLFSQQTGADLTTDRGKVELLDKIKTVVNQPLAGQQHAIVDDVLFNAFIIR
ncbi:flagellar basal body-associated protein FliL [Pantoea anthophila]|uniref:flagellar basal body-associated protein FliL n=1 Tax=Pantoea anthophila TaxID=470931 RepID=UPI0027899D43|nr:flagellar basal body-associated protein FliL [Pantoea anthophila]MDQ1213516.1 flagellar FliL protein [Pantoea anthophila]